MQAVRRFTPAFQPSVLLLLFALLFTLHVSGCGTVPLLDQEIYAMKSVTAARQVATASLRAGKITLAEDQKYQANLTIMANAIKAAVAANDAATIAAEKTKADQLKLELEKK